MPKSNFRLFSAILIGIPLVFILGMYFYPMSKLLFNIREFKSGSWLDGFRWDIISRTFQFTIYQAILSTFFTLVTGIPLTYLFVKYEFTGRKFFRMLTTLPFILPTVVVAAAFNALLSPNGWINLSLQRLVGAAVPIVDIQNSLSAIVIAHVFYNTSIVIRVLGGAWENLDPNLGNAALSLGASRKKAFWQIVFPQLLPSLISAILLVFLFDFTSFGVILMLGGPRFSTMEIEIYIQTVQLLNIPLAGVLATIQLIFTMIVSGISVRLSGGWNFPIFSRRENSLRIKPKKIKEKIFVLILILLLILFFGSPIFSLIARSIFTTPAEPGISIRNFRALFYGEKQSIFYVPPLNALANSLLFGLMAAGFTLTLAGTLLFAKKHLGKYHRLVDLLFLLPLGTSAVTLGLGFFVAFREITINPIFYYLLIPAAHTLIALPFVLRIIQPSFDAIPMRIRDAAGTLGASRLRILREIELPIIKPAMITSFIYAFMISLGEFGATSLLTRPDIPTMPIAIFRYLNFPGDLNFGRAMAMAVIILFVSAVGLFVIEKYQSQQQTIEKVFHASN